MLERGESLPSPKQQKFVGPQPSLATVHRDMPPDSKEGDTATYDAYWRKTIADERLLQSHTAAGTLILFQSYYHNVPLASLDRASPSTMMRAGLNPEKIRALRAIERDTSQVTRQQRFDGYLAAARAIKQNAVKNAQPKSTPTEWSRPSTTQRRRRFLGVRVVRVALQDPTIRASQVAIAGMDSWTPKGAYSFTLTQLAMHQRVARMNQFVHPVPSNSGLLSILGVLDQSIVRKWGSLFRTVGFEGIGASDWGELTGHIKKHVLIIRDDPVRPFFLALAEGLTQLNVARMALQLCARPSSWQTGFDALCFEPPEGLKVENRAEYFGTKNKHLGEAVSVTFEGVASRADRATPYRCLKRDARYDSDDEQLSVPSR